MDRKIANMERAAMLAAVLGIILGFISSTLADGSGRGKIINALLAIAFALFTIFFILIALIKSKKDSFDEAEEIIIPEEEPQEPFRFTNDVYDFLKGHGEVSEE